MRSRFLTRTRIVASAVLEAPRRRRLSGAPRRVLIAHHPKMMGDTLLLAHLAAKARHRWPEAEIVMTASRATHPLFAGKPWGVDARIYDPDDPRTVGNFRDGPGYDIAFVPGDNRYGWFARGAGARWIVGFGNDRPRYKNLLIDEAHYYPDTPGTWTDMAAALIPGDSPPPYAPGQWPAPPFAAFDAPRRPYAVIQLGASTPLKRWPPERWSELAAHLAARGLEVAWTCGPGEDALVAAVDPEGRHRAYPGTLDLAQMWHLIAGAEVVISLDTGIAHLARLVYTPTVVLFGPGSRQLVGNGEFFRDAPWSPVGIDPFPCRDQATLYKRPVEWVRKCSRSTRECPSPRCMLAIELRQVIDEIVRLKPSLAEFLHALGACSYIVVVAVAIPSSG